MAKRVTVTTQSRTHGQSGSTLIDDMNVIREQLSLAAGQISKVSIKFEGRETQFTSQLSDLKLSKDGFCVEWGAGLDRSLFQREMIEASTKLCMILIYVGSRFILGVQTECQEINQPVLEFKIPEKIFRLQRRKSVRYTIPAGYEFFVEYTSVETKKRARKQIIDLSEHGLAFFVLSPREADFFKIGSVQKHMTIKILNREIDLDLKIANCVTFDRGSKGKGKKIGCEFERINPKDIEFIREFVYSRLSVMT